MKKGILTVVLVLASLSSLSAQENNIKFYGFIRNYAYVDSRVSHASIEDFFYYLPKDQNLNSEGEDLNIQSSARMAAITSRVGLDASGYRVGDFTVGAKFEGDFYSGVSGVTGTATMRLRQAYMTLGWINQEGKQNVSLKLGQAWHPMSADMPDCFSYNTGAPFQPFSRTPLAQAEFKTSTAISFTAAAIWQMQYTSAGPEGASANYIKYGCTPELFGTVNYIEGPWTVKLGVDMVSIKPRVTDLYKYNPLTGYVKGTETTQVSDRITTFTPFFYLQYKKGDFAFKFKSVYAEAGEQVNLNGGYGISNILSDGSYEYSPTRNSTSWFTISKGKAWQAIIFGGYCRNFGTKEEIIGANSLCFSKNSFSNMNQMFRLTPSIVRNVGKFLVGVEYEVTGVQYGDFKGGKAVPCYGLATENLRWVVNNRVGLITKFTF